MLIFIIRKLEHSLLSRGSSSRGVCVCVCVCLALICTIHNPVSTHTLHFNFIKDNLCTEGLVTAGPALCPRPAH